MAQGGDGVMAGSKQTEGKHFEDGVFISRAQCETMGLMAFCPEGAIGIRVFHTNPAPPPPKRATRAEVYRAIDSERAYADRKWNERTTDTGGIHENLADWLLYIRSYIRKAEDHLASNPEPEATAAALEETRKIAGLAVAAMEQLGAPMRKDVLGAIVTPLGGLTGKQAEASGSGHAAGRWEQAKVLTDEEIRGLVRNARHDIVISGQFFNLLATVTQGRPDLVPF